MTIVINCCICFLKVGAGTLHGYLGTTFAVQWDNRPQTIPLFYSTHSYFFILAAYIEIESNFIKINGKDPTDLGVLWIRSVMEWVNSNWQFFSPLYS